MLIKNGGIYRNIDVADFPSYKEKGYVSAEPEQSTPLEPEAEPEQPAKPKGK